MIYDILPVNNYIGNNSTKTFDFDFYIEDYDQLSVNFFDENGTKETLKLNLDYAINEIKNRNGSYITFPIEGSKYEILKEGQKLSIELVLPIAQEIQYNNSSLLNLETLEYSLDYLTRLIQILARKTSLCLKAEENSDISLDDIVRNIYANAADSKKNLDKIIEIQTNIQDSKEQIKAIEQNIVSKNEKFETIDEIQETIQTKADINLANTIPSQSFADKTINWSMPDYTAGVDIWASLPYTAPTNGYICGSCAGSNSYLYLYINEEVLLKVSTPSAQQISIIPVAKGDVISLYMRSGNVSTIFYPVKGAKTDD